MPCKAHYCTAPFACLACLMLCVWPFALEQASPQYLGRMVGCIRSDADRDQGTPSPPWIVRGHIFCRTGVALVRSALF